jgi:hypothetical protein
MAEESTTFQCPHCGAAIAPTATGKSIVTCAACGRPVELWDNAPQGRDAAIDALRAQKIAASRRAAMRVQTYFRVVAIGCVAAAGECIYKAWYAGRWNVTRILLLGLAMCAVWGIVYFLRHASKVARELRKPMLIDPTTPPDFSQLGDGSQRVKDLENLLGEEPSCHSERSEESAPPKPDSSLRSK